MSSYYEKEALCEAKFHEFNASAKQLQRMLKLDSSVLNALGIN